MINIRTIKENVCIHCFRKEEAVELFSKLLLYGYRWNLTAMPLDSHDTHWDTYKYNSCYVLYQKQHTICYGDYTSQKTAGTVRAEYSDVCFDVSLREIEPGEVVSCPTRGDFRDVLAQLGRQNYVITTKSYINEWGVFKEHTVVQVLEDEFKVRSLQDFELDEVIRFSNLIIDKSEDDGPEQPREETPELTEEEKTYLKVKKIISSSDALFTFLAWAKQYDKPRYWQMLLGVNSLSEALAAYPVGDLLTAIFANGRTDDAYEESFLTALTAYVDTRVTGLQKAYAVICSLDNLDDSYKQEHLTGIMESFGGREKFCRIIADNTLAVWDDSKDREKNISICFSYALKSPESALAAYRKRYELD